MRREIVLLGDPVLRRKAKPVRVVDAATRKLIDDLTETMFKADGVGLAAPQVAVSKRVIVAYDGDDGPVYALVNPQIQRRSGHDTGREGCLSIPGLQGYVERSRTVVVTGLDRAGRSVTVEAEGFLARVLQHEIDHLNGVLFTDHTSDVWWLEVDGDGDDAEVRQVPTSLAEVEAHFARVREGLRQREAASE